ncbi:MAG TPA: DUF1587 domain-containing protein, partial [Polyangia bacterium]|nr:DUF1587 domain-containing protein [Polyangia bacterium]
MKAALWSALLFSFLSACSGDIGTPAASTGDTRNGPGGSGGTVAPVNCQQPQAAALNARLLSPSQYDNTVQDLLQVGGDPAKGFAGAGFAQVDDAAVEQRANAATAIAHQAAAMLAAWAPCAPAASTDTACQQQIIDRIG